jgi:hypothetical protein
MRYSLSQWRSSADQHGMKLSFKKKKPLPFCNEKASMLTFGTPALTSFWQVGFGGGAIGSGGSEPSSAVTNLQNEVRQEWSSIHNLELTVDGLKNTMRTPGPPGPIGMCPCCQKICMPASIQTSYE